MQARTLLALTLISLVLISLGFLTACGSGSSTHVQPSAPTFTSVPVTAATRNVAYTYELAAVDPAGGTVTFSLTSSPPGRGPQRKHHYLDSDGRSVARVKQLHGDRDHHVGRHRPAILDGHAWRHNHRQLAKQLLDGNRQSAGPGTAIGGC